MSIDTAVDGDPGSCRRTARALHDLHGRLAEARSYLDGQAHLAAAHFDGLSGDAYRTRCAAVGETVDAAADSSRGWARALNEYADGLDEVLAVMADAREVARRELVLHGHTIPTPGGYATDRQWRVYRTVAASVQAARRDEARLRDAWLSALAHYAVGPVEDLCLPEVTTPLTRGSWCGWSRGSAPARLAPQPPSHDLDHVLPIVLPPDSVWVPWGGGDAA